MMRAGAFAGPPLQLTTVLAPQRRSAVAHEGMPGYGSARRSDSNSPGRFVLPSGSVSPPRLQHRSNDYGSMGAIVGGTARLSRSTIEEKRFLGRSVGALRYPNRGAQTDRVQLKE